MENEEVEALLLDILNSTHEPVQVWGLGFLYNYPQLLEESQRLTKRVEEIFWQPNQSLIEKAMPLIIEQGGFRGGRGPFFPGCHEPPWFPWQDFPVFVSGLDHGWPFSLPPPGLYDPGPAFPGP